MTAGRKANTDNKNWCTPHKYVDAVKQVFGGKIDLDPCSNEHSIVGATISYCLPSQDGLLDSWDYRHIFVNPPYGSDKDRGTRISDWLKRCSLAHYLNVSEVLALVPVANNTVHWKQYVWGQAKAVAFLYDTRLRFLVNGKDGGKGAPMACAMVYWGTNFGSFANVFSQFGAVVDLRLCQTPGNIKVKQ